MDKLRAKAKKLGIDFDENTTEEELTKAIEEAEASNNNDDDPEFLKSELEKAIKRRDRATAERRKLAEQVEDMQSQLKNLVDPSQFKDLKKELDDLKKYKKEMDKKVEEEELAKKDEVGKLQFQLEKMQKEFDEMINNTKSQYEEQIQKEKEERESVLTQVQSLRKSKLEADIINAAAKSNAYNPSQIARLLKNDFEYDDKLGFQVISRKDGKIKDMKNVDDYVAEFLSSEENENLVKSNVNNSSFNSHKKSDTTNGNRNNFGKYDPKDPEIIRKAEYERMEPEDFITHVLIPYDKKVKGETDSNDK